MVLTNRRADAGAPSTAAGSNFSMHVKFCIPAPTLSQSARVQQMIKHHLLKLSVLAFALLFTASVPAQTASTASMIVTVVDQNGAVVKGANVSVVNTATGATHEAVSGAEGT